MKTVTKEEKKLFDFLLELGPGNHTLYSWHYDAITPSILVVGVLLEFINVLDQSIEVLLENYESNVMFVSEIQVKFTDDSNNKICVETISSSEYFIDPIFYTVEEAHTIFSESSAKETFTVEEDGKRAPAKSTSKTFASFLSQMKHYSSFDESPLYLLCFPKNNWGAYRRYDPDRAYAYNSKQASTTIITPEFIEKSRKVLVAGYQVST